MTHDGDDRGRRALRALALIGALSLPAAAPAQQADPPAIRVTGEAEVSVRPDMARIRLGVREEAPEAAAAVDAMSGRTDAVLAALEAAGIDRADISTGRLRLDPVREPPTQDAPPRVTGFVAEIGLTVTVRELDGLGEVLDAVVRDGANRFDGISFDLSDPADALDAARRDAVAEARRKAELYAEAAGVTLGPLLRLTEGATGGGGPRPMMEARAMAAVPVPEGELTLRAEVTLTYEVAAE